MVHRESQLEDKLIEYLVAHDMKAFVGCVTHNLFDKRNGGKGYEVIERAVKSAATELIEVSFGNPEEDNVSFLNALLAEVPGKLVGTVDPLVGKILLIPVHDLVCHYEQADNTEAIRELFEKSDIINCWPSITPRLWGDVGEAYQMHVQMAQAVQDELEGGDGGLYYGNVAKIGRNINKYLEKIRDIKAKCTVEEFHAIFTENLVELWDLVNIEMYLEAFPSELYQAPGEYRRYKTCFVRKIALACVKHYVHAHQKSKQRSLGGYQKVSLPKRERVVDTCILGNLDVVSSRDVEVRYFWSLLRKAWLSMVMRTGKLNLFELFDNLSSDDTLLNQMFLELVDRNNVEAVAQLLAWSESLRARQAFKHQLIDEPPLPFLLSVMGSTGGTRIDVFGPMRSDGFILPFALVNEPAADSNTAVSGVTTVIDRASQMHFFSDFVDALPIQCAVCVGVWHKTWTDVMLERPVPSVLAVASQARVMLVLVDRILAREKKSEKSKILRPIRKLFHNRPDVLKIFCSMGVDVMVTLGAMLAEDPFELASPVTPFGDRIHGGSICPVVDLTKCQPCIAEKNDTAAPYSFAQWVESRLHVHFCEFEKNSNWSGFLRNSQLHYAASKVWLGLHLVAQPPQLVQVDMRRYGQSGMVRNIENPEYFWDPDSFDQNLDSFFSLVESTQDVLRNELLEELVNADGPSAEDSFLVGDL